MTTAQRALEKAAASRRILDWRSEGRWTGGARLRLVVALAGLGALIAWGLLSNAATDGSADAEAPSAAQEAPRLDGRGKWTGYTSEWRSRPQILRDAGITLDR